MIDGVHSMLYQGYGLQCVWWRLVFQVNVCPARVTSFLISEEELVFQVHICLARVTAYLVSEGELECQVHYCLARVTAYPLSEQELPRLMSVLSGLRPTHCLNKSLPGKRLPCQGYGLPIVWTRACQVNVCLASVTAYPLFDQELARQMSVLPGLRLTYCLKENLKGKVNASWPAHFRAGIFKKSMGARNRRGIGLSYRPARLHGLAEFIPLNQFRGPINI
jgi:hypothetical protein